MPVILPVKPVAYELILLLKNLPKDELASVVKRCAQGIFKRGGFLRKLEYLGLQQTPYRLSKNGLPYHQANYFYSEFHIPKALIPDLYNEYVRDIDVVKHTFQSTKLEDIDYENCTFEDELKPVPYRSQVIKLVKTATEFEKKKVRRRVKLNTNTDFYPFRK